VTVLCLLEREGDGLAGASLRALAVAATAAAAAGTELAAVAFECGDGELAGAARADLAPRGVSVLCVVPSAALAAYAPVAWARTLHGLMESDAAVAVIAAATDRGHEVLAQLGALSGLPVAANCVSFAPAGDGSWRLVRQRWAGSLLEEAILDAPCALLSVAADAAPGDVVPAEVVVVGVVPGDAVAVGAGPAGVVSAGVVCAGAVPAGAVPAGAVPAGAVSAGAVSAGVVAAEADGGPAVRVLSPQFEEADLCVIATESDEAGGGMSLATARVVVGGGRGVGGPDGFAVLEELAGLLGGVVGVSRVVTSQGWRPHRQQVGQTGTKISPELYLACGISGAIQHMAGCLGAKHIVAVNTDPDAPIVSRAEYAVIGDLNEVIPALVAAIRERTAG
jgi:electron transfer flavoprotein alpha subunit